MLSYKKLHYKARLEFFVHISRYLALITISTMLLFILAGCMVTNVSPDGTSSTAATATTTTHNNKRHHGNTNRTAKNIKAAPPPSSLPPSPITVHFQKKEFKNLIAWHHDNHLQAFNALCDSCRIIMRKKDHNSQMNRFSNIGGKVSDWVPACSKALNSKITNNKQARMFFETNFHAYAVLNDAKNDMGKFTGYYEMEINGSRKRSSKYKYPIYKAPRNLKQLQGTKALEHASINRGALQNKGLEIFWVDDRIKLFYMHIQGSGIIKLSDRTKVRVTFDGHNGFSYSSITKYFSQYTGISPKSTEEMIRWLKHHPADAQKIMERNKSYVFFKEKPSLSAGPVGAQGVTLHPERSIAVDYYIFPYGVPFWVEAKLPKITNYHNVNINYHKLMIAQDTGGSIRGAIRGDIFFGNSERASDVVNHMNCAGRYYALFPREVVVRESYKITNKN